MGLGGSNPPPISASASSSSMKPSPQYPQQQQQQQHAAARNTTPATSFSSSSASLNSSGDEEKQAHNNNNNNNNNRPSLHTLHTATRAPSSTKRKTAAALVVQVENDDDSLPDDGVHRVSWDAFLRFPPKIIKKEGNDAHDTNMKSGLKRKRQDSGPHHQGHDRLEEERNTVGSGEVPKAKKIKMTWNGRFGQLREYYEEHGNTRVPQTYQEDQSFSHWVAHQRRKYTKRIRGEDPAALSDSRFALLESLGFEAQKRAGEQQPKEILQPAPPPPPPPRLPDRDLNPKFQKRLDQLHAFKEVFNHMKVPKHYEIVKGLHLWVKNIHAHPGLLLDEEREALLDIGFKWTGKRQEFNVRPSRQNKTVAGDDQKKKKALNASWVRRIKQLNEYHKEFGDFRVPVNYERDPSLGPWVQTQHSKFIERKEGKKESMADHKFEALEKLGFGAHVEHVVHPKQKTLSATWLKRLEQLKLYKEVHGNFRVPMNYDKDPSLGAWVLAQRSKFTERKRGKKGCLSDHKFEALEKIGFGAHTEQPAMSDTMVKQSTKPAVMEQLTKSAAKPATSKWSKRLEQLKSFKKEHGHFQVPEEYKKDPSLYFWLKKQQLRFKRRKGGHVEAMAEHKFQALQELGLDVCTGKKPAQDEFATRLAQLKAFKKERGHTLVGKDCVVPGLRNWTNAVRRQHQKKELGQPSELLDDHVDALNTIGFVWIKKKNGQKTVSAAGSSEPETSALSNTGVAEKTSNKDDSISNNGIVKKKAAGFSWEQNFEKLKRFQSTHGHCKLDSEARKEDPVFAAWVQKQRERYTQKARGDNGLAEHKYDSFRSLGFEPCATRQPLSEAEFEKKFALLNQFKRKFGHVRVSTDSSMPDLEAWVDLVRQAYRKKQKGENSKLTQDQIDMLGDVGFEWIIPEERNNPATLSTDQRPAIKNSPADPGRGRISEKQDTSVTSSTKGPAPDKSPAAPGERQDIYVTFTVRLEQLASFHRQYGHTKVPPDYTEAPGLRKWLDTMRYQYVNNRRFITEENLELLTSLKFDWLKDTTATNEGSAASGKHDNPAGSNIWFGYLKELKKYEAAHGDTRVPKRHKNNQQFADWVYEQRMHFSKRCNGDKAALSDQRYFALEKIGFEAATIGSPSSIFQRRMTELKDFYGIFGHAKVHKTYNTAPGLRKWLEALRIKYKLWEEGDPTAMPVCELDILEGLGFDWLGRKGKFASKKNDDSPSKYAEDTTTAVSAPVSVDLFRKHDTSWAGRLKQLEDFKAVHGHIDIPTVYEVDQSFSNWVRTQKRLFSQRTRGLTDALADDRFETLQRLGF